jgi:hypothetical protein
VRRTKKFGIRLYSLKDEFQKRRENVILFSIAKAWVILLLKDLAFLIEDGISI